MRFVIALLFAFTGMALWPQGAHVSAITETGAAMIVKGVWDNVPGKAPPGTRLFAVDVLIDNSRGSAEIPAGGFLFRLSDADGYVYGRASSDDVSNFPAPMLYGSVPPGDELRGWIVFQVKKGVTAENLRIRYEWQSETSKHIGLAGLPDAGRR